MPRWSPVECRCRPGRAPVYRCTVALQGLCQHIPGLHLGNTSDNRDVAGALPDNGLFPVPSRLFPVPRRSLPVLPGDSRFIPEELNILILSRWSPGRPRFIPVVPGGAPGHNGRAPIHPGRSRITHRDPPAT
ncbi:hypothetical protein DPMN_185799 [Dreissena polymorpha]|uniref:Uncharacterized protein n=1 Tax=Dreissena polymorpha TaxID=45954 RepID=A0A9D4DM42_DREPO|nr:hypothetical protein DPMN_185799 [Dreissena polymorpha]